ncbi:hypothetical protein DXG03_004519 [Asterophora parasitica]|uniref:C2 domain-containing protein n=1 Tax=Asterophora parasitica TaxID=117018 RepID=A0A9P7KA83_9AGAR|nr:hypothetical protein DXG03_004519 [Asterophora parasitica]
MAINIPSIFFRRPRCYASITLGSGPAQETAVVKGANPAWTKTFIFEAAPSSTFSINIVQKSSIFGRNVIAKLEDLVIPSACFEQEITTIHDVRSSMKVVVKWSPAVVTGKVPPTSAAAVTVPTPTIKEVQDISRKWTPADSRSSDRLATVLGYVSVLVKIGDKFAEVHPIAKAAWTVIKASHEVIPIDPSVSTHADALAQIFEAQLEREAKVRELWDIIIDTLDFMEEAEPLKKMQGLETTIQAIMSQLYDCALHLKDYEQKGFFVKVAGGALSTAADDTLTGFVDSFTAIKLKLHQRVSVENWKGIVHLHRQSDIDTLEKIPGAKIQSKWTSESEIICLPATREQLLSDIFDWILTGSETLYWLSGAAGTGKSSVANSVASQCKLLGHLGAFFEFRQDEISLESPYHLFGNLAYQIAFFNDALCKAIVAEYQNFPAQSRIDDLLQLLLLKPLQITTLSRSLVIIIDGLDECVISGKQGHDAIVNILGKVLKSLPKNVKILVTSCHKCTLDQLNETSMGLQQDLTSIDHTEKDIELYINFRLADIAAKKNLGKWKAVTNGLVEQADNLGSYKCYPMASKPLMGQTG